MTHTSADVGSEAMRAKNKKFLIWFAGFFGAAVGVTIIILQLFVFKPDVETLSGVPGQCDYENCDQKGKVSYYMTDTAQRNVGRYRGNANYTVSVFDVPHTKTKNYLKPEHEKYLVFEDGKLKIQKETNWVEYSSKEYIGSFAAIRIAGHYCDAHEKKGYKLIASERNRVMWTDYVLFIGIALTIGSVVYLIQVKRKSHSMQSPHGANVHADKK